MIDTKTDNQSVRMATCPLIYYVITASQPGNKGQWRKNIFVGVAARSIYKAMDLFSENYPDAIISNIAKRGEINIGVDGGSSGK